MTQLILHIGLRKTGSAALQELFSGESEALHEHGLDYPTRLMPFPAQQELAWRVMDFLPPYVEGLPEAEDVFAHYRQKIAAKDVKLSSFAKIKGF